MQRNRRAMKIGWVIPTVGTFGAVREMVEVSNVLAHKGHKITIYHPHGDPVKWLPCSAECKKLTALREDVLDVLIGIVDWQPELYQNLLNARAGVKAICLLGFAPTEEMAQALRGEKVTQDRAEKIILDAIQRKFLILADSSWQVDWMRKTVGYPAGPAFGGVNLEMFKPGRRKRQDRFTRIIYSGDPRERKGTDTVLAAIDILKAEGYVDLKFDAYWGQRFSQEQLVEFIQQGDIFLDGHRRAGWCNPVAEAMACGTVPVCTRIGANADFAIHEQTALVVAVDDAPAMAAATKQLLHDPGLKNRLIQNGLQKIQQFSYNTVATQLEAALEKQLAYAQIAG